MKTRSSDKPASSSSAPTDDKKTLSPKKEEKPEMAAKVDPDASPSKRTHSEVKKDEKESDEQEKGDEQKEVKDEDKKPRKKPKTEGVSEVGEKPPKSFGEPTGKDAERKHGILEHGHIYFLYRPKVEVDEVHGHEDIAHLHMILMPSDLPGSYRQITIGRNILPKRTEGATHKRPDILWGKVLDVSDTLSTLKERLGPRTYDTKTRGTRHIGPARVAGAGSYILHSEQAKDTPKASKNMTAVYKTVIAYALKTPHDLGEVQKRLHIEAEGSFQLQVKNPTQPSNSSLVRDVPTDKRPAFPKSLSSLFTTKFIPCNPASLLNYSGAELLFLPSHASVEEQLGEEGEKELLDLVKEDGGEENGHAGAKAALRELGVEDLVEGKALEGYWE